MSATDVLAVALGGGAGSLVRYLVALRLDGRHELPFGTGLVNVLGSGLLGLIVGAGIDGSAGLLLAAGFCGALTTYSSFAFQITSLRRANHGRWHWYAGVSLVVGVLAAALGYWVATAAF